MNKFYEGFRREQREEKGYHTCCDECQFNEVWWYFLKLVSTGEIVMKPKVKEWLRGYLK